MRQRIKSIALILILITSLGCQNSDFNPEGIWIGLYSSLVLPPDFEKDENHKRIIKERYSEPIQNKKIISINGDSMTLTRFNETLYYGFDEYQIRYEFGSDSLKMEYNGNEGSVKYSYDGKRLLSLDFDNSEYIRYRDYFVQLKEFKMRHKKSEINSFLANHPIAIGQRKDKIEILPTHWNHMGEFIQDSLETDYGYGNDWHLYTLEEELFLTIGNFFIHISDFNNNKIYGLTYFNKISPIELRKESYANKFVPELLTGNWVNINSEIDDYKQNHIQKMVFTEDSVFVESNSYKDTLVWKFNKYSNKIMIENDNYGRHGSYWKIEQLSKRKLVIKRKVEKDNSPEIEVLNLVKE